MREREEYTFLVNGFETQASFCRQSTEEIWIPLVKHFNLLWQERKERIVVFLAAPPAVGKSTLAEFLAVLSRQMGAGMKEIQPVGMDGFHYPGSYIKEHEVEINGNKVPMQHVKGCPETFDYEKLEQLVRELRQGPVWFPVYDRNLHDVVAGAVYVAQDIVLLEGNWLLLDEAPWKDLKALCDYSIFVKADPDLLKERLIKRKVKGGFSEAEALAFYERSDQVNVLRSLTHRLPADLEVEMLADGFFKKE